MSDQSDLFDQLAARLAEARGLFEEMARALDEAPEAGPVLAAGFRLDDMLAALRAAESTDRNNMVVAGVVASLRRAARARVGLTEVGDWASYAQPAESRTAGGRKRR